MNNAQIKRNIMEAAETSIISYQKRNLISKKHLQTITNKNITKGASGNLSQSPEIDKNRAWKQDYKEKIDQKPNNKILKIQELPSSVDTSYHVGTTGNVLNIYLKEIGKIQLLTAEEERAIGRQIEIERHVLRIKNECKRNAVTAIDFFKVLIMDLWRLSEIIQKLQENLDLPLNLSFRQVIDNEKIRGAVDGVIDPRLVRSIATTLNFSEPYVEAQMVIFSTDIAILHEKVLATICDNTSFANLPNLMMDSNFTNEIEIQGCDIFEYLERLQAAGKIARDHLIEANLKLVISIAKNYIGSGMFLQDIIQEGNVGLIQAVDHFNLHKGCRFSSYAHWWIRSAISAYISDQSRAVRLPISMIRIINKLKTTSRNLEQEYGRDPTLEEIGQHLRISPKQVSEVIQIAQLPVSLETPIGDDHGTCLGDMIEDNNAIQPFDSAYMNLLKDQIGQLLLTLTPIEKRVLQLRFGLNDGISRTLEEIGLEFSLTRERIRQIEGAAIQKLRESNYKWKLKDYLHN